MRQTVEKQSAVLQGRSLLVDDRYPGLVHLVEMIEVVPGLGYDHAREQDDRDEVLRVLGRDAGHAAQPAPERRAGPPMLLPVPIAEAGAVMILVNVCILFFLSAAKAEKALLYRKSAQNARKSRLSPNIIDIFSFSAVCAENAF